MARKLVIGKLYVPIGTGILAPDFVGVPTELWRPQWGEPGFGLRVSGPEYKTIVEALKFYGNSDNWVIIDGIGRFNALYDLGNRARAALSIMEESI